MHYVLRFNSVQMSLLCVTEPTVKIVQYQKELNKTFISMYSP